MANLILTEVGWEQRIRSQLGVDEAFLPDTDIRKPDVIGVAEQHIIDELSNYDEDNEELRVWVEAAVVCQCSIIICTQLKARLPRQQEGPHASYQIEVNWDEVKKELIEKRDYYLSKADPGGFPKVRYFGVSR